MKSKYIRQSQRLEAKRLFGDNLWPTHVHTMGLRRLSSTRTSCKLWGPDRHGAWKSFLDHDMFWHLPNCSQNVKGSRGPNMSIGKYILLPFGRNLKTYIYIYIYIWDGNKKKRIQTCSARDARFLFPFGLMLRKMEGKVEGRWEYMRAATLYESRVWFSMHGCCHSVRGTFDCYHSRSHFVRDLVQNGRRLSPLEMWRRTSYVFFCTFTCKIPAGQIIQLQAEMINIYSM